jgi:hypothetical protein
VKSEDLRKIIREEYSKILSEQIDYDYAIDQFNTLYTNLQDLHQEIGTQLESENEQQFVTFSRYMGALETGLDNTVKFLKRNKRGQATMKPSIYPGGVRESKIKEVK